MPTSTIRQLAAESELLLAAILDQSQDCIKLLNASGEIEYMNENGRRALAIEDFAEVVGKQWATLWPEEARHHIETSIDKTRRGQQSRFEALCPTLAGTPTWWDVSVGPVCDRDGRLRHILATSRDVTEYMSRMSEQLRREEAEEQAKHSDSVAHEMRHRLKNQLAVVGSVAKLLSRHSDSAADMQVKLERKIAALARAQDMLTVHREEPVSAAAALEQVLGASGAGERIEVLEMPEVPLGDDGVQQLALMVGELQTNSLKYGALRDDKGKITLSATQEEHLLCMHWHEDIGEPLDTPEHVGAGMILLDRLGSTGSHTSRVEWHSSGPAATFYLRTLA
ncbi:PAS domain-containing protein [Erythrobacter sp. SD-21]|uniref:PAS domain-containing protein n=1 Tax=Erythrobacter sp. SD-21 TaxID=161528 RepID=UPI000153F7BC|nr:PAS domain-containing protein [Erythrobacter sp. SD-21]EDL48437.1 sensor histidine kinase, putative [Erythrobacter sp. SD-21]